MNTVVEYEKILDIVRQELEIIRVSDSKFSEIKLVVEDERLLAKKKDRSPETMYIQVKFGAASTNFGQAVLPFSMEVIGINQDIQLTQDLLNVFVNTYNRSIIDNITQFYLTPVVSQNNIPIYEGYRSLFIISSTFVISNDLVILENLKYLEWDEEAVDWYEENIEVLVYTDVVEAELNPQPYPDGGGKAMSYGSFQTFAFSIATYPDANKRLIKKLWKWKYDRTTPHANDDFDFRGTFKMKGATLGDTTDFAATFKCKSCDFSYRVGENPVVNVTFTM